MTRPGRLRRSAARHVVVLLALWTVATPGAAQAEFEARYAAAEQARLAGTAPAEDVRAAYETAVATFEEWSSGRDSEDLVPYLPAAGFAAEQAGQHETAATWYGLALTVSAPSEFLVGARLRALLASDQPVVALSEARRWFETQADAVRGQLGALLPAAGRCLRQGETELAIWLFRYGVDVTERDAVSLANLALALRHLGQIDEAERLYREALERSPSDPVLWNDFGLFLKGVGRRVEAATALSRSLTQEEPPRDGPATGNLVDMIRLGIPIDLPPDLAREFTDLATVLAGVLRTFPSGDMTRRRCIDEILAGH